ncbi:MAG: UDP-N-acetylmuramoyl-L-alanyl-D-glutamate--2,6-diaminopimelate ligase [Desulfobulbus sp.]|jgi:murE/murF fusion protein
MRTLAKLLHILNPRAVSGLTEEAGQMPVTGVTADSRQVELGMIFVAVRGERADGRAYLAEAVRRGAVAVVLDDERGQHLPHDAVVALVADSHAAVAELAAAWNGYPARQMRLIGVTGTNGKTTCSWLIEALLLASGRRPGVIGTVNYRYHDGHSMHLLGEAPMTTPDPVRLQGLLREMADHGVTDVIMEVSSHALQQRRLGQTLFDVALFTNLSRDHLDYHPTMEAYFQAKQQLFLQHLKEEGRAVVVVGAADDERDWGRRLLASLHGRPVICCGEDHSCQVRAESPVFSVDGCRCELVLDGRATAFVSPLAGAYNLRNILAAAGVGMALGCDPERIRAGLQGLGRVPGRLERVVLPGGEGVAVPAVFVDYAHTPDALDNVLQTLSGLARGRLICVFGCGGDRDRGKRPLMGAMALRHADLVIVTSDNPRSEDPEKIIGEILVGMADPPEPEEDGAALLLDCATKRRGYSVVPNRRDAIRLACSLADPRDTVLIAGKGHENYQIIGTERHFFDDRQEVLNGLLHWNSRHLSAALAPVGGEVVGGSLRGELGEVCTDSRAVEPGDIFVALRGENFDGHDYIIAAIDRGAAVVIGEQLPDHDIGEALCFRVDDTLRALGALAGYRRRLLGPAVRVAAITGSSGKTTVKELAASIFAAACRNQWSGGDPVLKTQGNFNNLVGLPLSLLPLSAGHRLAILEMGMNTPGEIDRLTRIADPDIGCINNVHPAHLQGLGSLAGVAAAKGELFAAMRPEAVRVVNYDDPLVRDLARKAGGRQIGFATTERGRRAGALVRTTRVQNLGEQGMRFTLHIGPWSRRINVALLGEHNVANCAAAAAIAHGAGIDPEVIAEGLCTHAPAVDKRLAVTTIGGIRVVNDAYNANPASMAAGLRTVAACAQGHRCMAALGDMLELGEDAAELHARIGAEAAALGYQGLALSGAHAAAVAGAAVEGGMAPDRVRLFADPVIMADWFAGLLAAGELEPGDWLLIKGSRGMRMERLLEALARTIDEPQPREPYVL